MARGRVAGFDPERGDRARAAVERQGDRAVLPPGRDAVREEAQDFLGTRARAHVPVEHVLAPDEVTHAAAHEERAMPRISESGEESPDGSGDAVLVGRAESHGAMVAQPSPGEHEPSATPRTRSD